MGSEQRTRRNETKDAQGDSVGPSEAPRSVWAFSLGEQGAMDGFSVS